MISGYFTMISGYFERDGTTEHSSSTPTPEHSYESPKPKANNKDNHDERPKQSPRM